MRNNRNQNTSAVPGKRRATKDHPDGRSSRRPEGTVHDHQARIKRNGESKHPETVNNTADQKS